MAARSWLTVTSARSLVRGRPGARPGPRRGSQCHGPVTRPSRLQSSCTGKQAAVNLKPPPGLKSAAETVFDGRLSSKLHLSCSMPSGRLQSDINHAVSAKDWQRASHSQKHIQILNLGHGQLAGGHAALPRRPNIERTYVRFAT